MFLNEPLEICGEVWIPDPVRVGALAVIAVIRDEDLAPRPLLHDPSQTVPIAGVSQHSVADDQEAAGSTIIISRLPVLELAVMQVHRRVRIPMEQSRRWYHRP